MKEKFNKNRENLSELSIRLCENLPFNFTLYEKDGNCKKPSEYCEYCKRSGDVYFCHKKTYILITNLMLL